MRFLVILILLGAISGGTYYISSVEIKSDVEITGKLQMSQQPDYDIKTPQTSNPLYFVVVKGKVKNNTSKPLENIFIRYSIAGQQTSATIFDLAPGQVLDFNTRGVKTSAANPEYSYEGVQYDEKLL